MERIDVLHNPDLSTKEQLVVRIVGVTAALFATKLAEHAMKAAIMYRKTKS